MVSGCRVEKSGQKSRKPEVVSQETEKLPLGQREFLVAQKRHEHMKYSMVHYKSRVCDVYFYDAIRYGGPHGMV